jgi:hypothetical protein
MGVDYYRNLAAEDFSALPLAEMFSECRFWYLPTHFDLYFAGVRAGGSGAQLPDTTGVGELTGLMGLSDRLVRLPLRLAIRFVPEPRYQSMILPYWSRLSRARDRWLGLTGGA